MYFILVTLYQDDLCEGRAPCHARLREGEQVGFNFRSPRMYRHRFFAFKSGVAMLSRKLLVPKEFQGHKVQCMCN